MFFFESRYSSSSHIFSFEESFCRHFWAIFKVYRIATQTALVGNYSNGVLDFAQVAHLKAVIDDKGIKIPLFTEPDGRLYKREIATYDFVTSDPLLPDPYESKMVECRRSRVRLFALH